MIVNIEFNILTYTFWNTIFPVQVQTRRCPVPACPNPQIPASELYLHSRKLCNSEIKVKFLQKDEKKMYHSSRQS